MTMEIAHYLTPTGEDPFQSWLDELAEVKARVAVLRRVDRVSAGNFGDH
jgi:putative component of toxin-antitoxin plasmid stabilization module